MFIILLYFIADGGLEHALRSVFLTNRKQTIIYAMNEQAIVNESEDRYLYEVVYMGKSYYVVTNSKGMCKKCAFKKRCVERIDGNRFAEAEKCMRPSDFPDTHCVCTLREDGYNVYYEQKTMANSASVAAGKIYGESIEIPGRLYIDDGSRGDRHGIKVSSKIPYREQLRLAAMPCVIEMAALQIVDDMQLKIYKAANPGKAAYEGERRLYNSRTNIVDKNMKRWLGGGLYDACIDFSTRFLDTVERSMKRRRLMASEDLGACKTDADAESALSGVTARMLLQWADAYRKQLAIGHNRMLADTPFAANADFGTDKLQGWLSNTLCDMGVGEYACDAYATAVRRDVRGSIDGINMDVILNRK